MKEALDVGLQPEDGGPTGRFVDRHEVEDQGAALDRVGQVGGRMDFIRFSGELLIYYVLLALGGVAGLAGRLTGG